ncbi:DUF1269 domain-containing protein [Marinobacter sp. F4206]|uniref:DUF1269 domain-containing protein n=1 Tax=Marinobacter sp. F4206 TaxID=2861777 RepID=UPI001C5EC0DA|nr:DUF1269 domain-containing protein [Marinobacter sp. F4206]MBW4936029.1 DUF1269 domain-containing protein [Marinobacter sp. F4206]
MSDLVAVIFDDETTAFDMRAALAKMQKEYFIEMDDCVVVTKNEKGKVKLHQSMNLSAAGAVNGGFWGVLFGLIFFNPLLGAAIGAGSGALAGKLSDIGIDDQMMKEVASGFTPGSSGLFVLIRKATTDKVLEGLKEFAGQGKVLRTSLKKDSEEALRQVLESV